MIKPNLFFRNTAHTFHTEEEYVYICVLNEVAKKQIYNLACDLSHESGPLLFSILT